MASSVHLFTFNPLQENTYLLINQASREAIVIDPGCSSPEECHALDKVIEREKATLVGLLATHLHFDHVWGAPHLTKKYGLPLLAHEKEIENTSSIERQARSFMIPLEESFKDVQIKPFQTGEIFNFGESQLEALFTPGHSAGHVTYYNRAEKYVCCGDVVFRGNIGRCDLEGGSYSVMLNTLKNVFVPLSDETIIYPGHGPETTIGYEKKNNPYIMSVL